MKKKVFGIVLATVLALSLGLVFAAPVGADPGPGIVGLWHLDDGSGTTATDSSGNGNDGALRMGTSLDFDGIDDYVSIPENTNLDGLLALTIEAWICPDSVTRGAIIGKYDTCGTPHYVSYYLSLVDGEVRVFVGQDQSHWEYAETDSAVLSTGTWYHVAGTWDGGSGASSFRIYVNGIEESTNWHCYKNDPVNGTISSMLDSTVDVELGTLHCVVSDSGRSAYFDGKMSGVRISDVARTSFEACGVPTIDGNTVALLHLDEGGTAQIAYDATDNDNDGQLGSASGSDTNDPAWQESGPTWTAGKCGDALSFDGDDDWVCVPDDSSLDGMSALTVEAWIYIESVTETYHGIIDKCAGSGDRSYNLGLRDGKLEWGVANASNTKVYARDVDLAPLDQWIHVVGTYDGSEIELCIDGISVDSTPLTGNVQDSSTYLAFGKFSGGDYYFDGLIDEVRIWDTATPIFSVDAEPETGVNPVGTTHDVDVDVTVDDTEPASCVEVNFEVTDGPNLGYTDSAQADCNGEVTFTYPSNGAGAGTDTICIWVDQDCSGTFDDSKDAYDEVAKTWVDLVGLTPDVAYNPVGGEHCVTAQVDPPVAGAKVFFEVSGANTASGSRTTVAGGTTPEFCYDGDNPGIDTILAYLEVDGDAGYDGDDDIGIEVTKYWLEHFVTGGGNITEGKGKNAQKITWGGNIGFALEGDPVGQFNVVFHNVGDIGSWDDTELDKGHFHSTEITSLIFDRISCSACGDCVPEPDPPDAYYNKADFSANGLFNGDTGWRIRVRLTDFGEPGKGNDEIRFKLYHDGGKVYDSSEYWDGDFPDSDNCNDKTRRHPLDGGNLQIHPPVIPIIPTP